MTEHNHVEILLIEDNHQEAELAIRSLKKQNLANHLKHIDDGPEALDFIFSRGAYGNRKKSQNPKLILLDLQVPKVDGLEILRQLKGNEETRIIPVVILTSSAEEKDVIESYKLGANSYIVKPVNFDSFGKAVSELGLYWLLLNHNPLS